MLDYQSPFPADGIHSGTDAIRFSPMMHRRIMQCASWNTDAAVVRAAVAQRLNLSDPLPATGSQSHMHGDIALFAVGPGRMWCVGKDDDPILATWPADEVTEQFAWADISDNHAVLNITGRHVFRLLSKATTIAFSHKDFAGNAVCRTVIRPSIPVVIRRLPDANDLPAIELYIARSYTRSACDYLSDLTTTFSDTDNTE